MTRKTCIENDIGIAYELADVSYVVRCETENIQSLIKRYKTLLCLLETPLRRLLLHAG